MIPAQFSIPGSNGSAKPFLMFVHHSVTGPEYHEFQPLARPATRSRNKCLVMHSGSVTATAVFLVSGNTAPNVAFGASYSLWSLAWKRPPSSRRVTSQFEGAAVTPLLSPRPHPRQSPGSSPVFFILSFYF